MTPDRRLLSILLVPTALGALSFHWPVLQGPGWGTLVVVAALLAVDWRGARRRAAPVAHLELPHRVRAGEPVELALVLHNPDATAQHVRALVELPPDLGGDHELPAVDLAPGERRALALPRTCRRRGLRPVGPVVLAVRSPLGLHWRIVRCDVREELAVLPPYGPTGSALEAPELLLFARAGVRPRRPRGEGLEFESLREYVPGDEPRHIDWCATARQGKTIVRQYQVERNHDIVLAVETGRLMSAAVQGTTKLDHALSASVALAQATRHTGDRVGFAAFDESIQAWIPPIEPRRALTPLLEATLGLEPRSCEPRYRALAQAIGVRQRRRALVIVLTDFVGGSAAATLESYLGVLARRHCVLLVALRDPLLSTLETSPGELDRDRFLERIVLQDLLVERETVLARVQRLGALTLDVHPEQVTAPLLSQYLEIRQAGLI